MPRPTGHEAGEKQVQVCRQGERTYGESPACSQEACLVQLSTELRLQTGLDALRVWVWVDRWAKERATWFVEALQHPPHDESEHVICVGLDWLAVFVQGPDRLDKSLRLFYL